MKCLVLVIIAIGDESSKALSIFHGRHCSIFEIGLNLLGVCTSRMRNSSKSCLKRKLLKQIMRQRSERKYAKHRSEILPIIGFRLISAWIYVKMGLGEAK